MLTNRTFDAPLKSAVMASVYKGHNFEGNGSAFLCCPLWISVVEKLKARAHCSSKDVLSVTCCSCYPRVSPPVHHHLRACPRNRAQAALPLWRSFRGPLQSGILFSIRWLLSFSVAPSLIFSILLFWVVFLLELQLVVCMSFLLPPDLQCVAGWKGVVFIFKSITLSNTRHESNCF